MVINELTAQECTDFLARAAFGRLGCSLKDQAYVVPIAFAYRAEHVYVLSTVGQKVEWMRENPKVCLQVDDIKGETDWVSVIAYGTFQELIEPQFSEERSYARKLLEQHPGWWRTALAQRLLKSSDPLIDPLFFRIQVRSITGLRATE